MAVAFGVGAPLLAAGIVLVLTGVERMKEYRVTAARGGVSIRF